MGTGAVTGSVAGRTAAAEGEATPDVLLRDRELPLAYSATELMNSKMNGGVGVGGIPAITSPEFVPAADAPDQLAPGDPVFGIRSDGVAKAYPQYILVWHEIVNDVIDGTQIAMTYCPLTATAQAFARGNMAFRVSGELINSNLVLLDQRAQTLWPQMLGWGVSGDLKGYFLDEFRVIWTTWERWKAAHPQTQVLTEDTGHVRDYGRDPYGTYNPAGGYYTDGGVMFSVMNRDDRFHPKEVMLGARTRDGAIAAAKRQLRDDAVLGGTVGDHVYRLVYDAQFDTGWFYRAEEPVTVTADENAYLVDDEGPYPPAELPLEPVLTIDAFWFAWAAYFPETALLHQPTGTAPFSDAGTGGTDGGGTPTDAPPNATNSAADPMPGFGLAAGGAAAGGAYGLFRRFQRSRKEPDDTSASTATPSSEE